MSYDPTHLTERTRDQLLTDFDGVNPEQLKMLNLIFSLFKAIDGAGATSPAIAALTPVTTPDATDEASAITLTNANKAKINAIITALKAT